MKSQRDVGIPGAEELELHSVYCTLTGLRANNDAIEAGLFHLNRDQFTQLSLTLFHTMSFYFERGRR